MARRGLQFGIFLAPFHRKGDNPTLAIARDIEMIEWLDRLGYDEAWIGEHHSAGWEIIASPELVIAAAAERTRHIRLGTGVTSLPYHHPFLVAQRFVQLDHMTRGRAMLGCGPGALVSDAYMLGIEPSTQRRRMDEALEAIMALLALRGAGDAQDGLVRDARGAAASAPVQRPAFPDRRRLHADAVGADRGGEIRRRHALARRPVRRAGSMRSPASGGSSRRRRRRPARSRTGADWRMVMNVHVAETDEQAIEDVRVGERLETVTYFEDALGRPPGRSQDPLTEGVQGRQHAGGLARDGGARDRDADREERGRVRRLPVPRA